MCVSFNLASCYLAMEFCSKLGACLTRLSSSVVPSSFMEDCSFGAGSPTYGFRKDRSAADLFVYLTHHWAQTIESKVDGEFSNPRLLINAGIPQGCVLSPTMFLLHIIDMLGITVIHSYLCLSGPNLTKSDWNLRLSRYL